MIKRDFAEKIERLGYPPAEFARLMGRHPSWGYRQLYAGKVNAVTSLGRTIIPAYEVERILASAEPYNPKPRRPKAEPLEAAA